MCLFKNKNIKKDRKYDRKSKNKINKKNVKRQFVGYNEKEKYSKYFN